MKTKALVLLFFTFFCVSCDVSTPFVVQGEKEYILSSDCGTMVIRGSSFSTGVCLYAVYLMVIMLLIRSY